MPRSVKLPIEDVIPDVRRALDDGRSAVLEAPPGAGKTTIVPLALLDEAWLSGRRIVMLEPRRLAARAAAYRMSTLLGEGVGETVGYRTRLDSVVGPSTRIEVVTEGVLTRLLQADPALAGAGIVIFDEFHERSVHADLGLALCLEARSLFRDDLRVLVMSATLDGSEVAALLGGAPVIRSVGRAFPVEVRYLPEAVRPSRPALSSESLAGPAFISTASRALIKALKEEQGGVLVFLPGSGEIRRLEALLRKEGLPVDIDLIPLYGDLPREAQDLAIRPSPPGRRKVVLATSIAETSLTIDGIRVVIDGGLQRTPRFSPATGMSTLETIRVTKASRDQRSGRAGRLEPGVSIRLWSEAEDNALRDRNTPEIMEADLAPLALELALWGVKAPGELRWLDPPPDSSISHAREILIHLGAFAPDGNVTPHGKEIARLPLHPRLGHMLLKGRSLGLGGLASYIAALLMERDIFKAGPLVKEKDSDIRHRLEVLLGYGGGPYQEADRALCERIRAEARHLMRQLNIKDRPEGVEEAGILLAFAYPDRIGKKREGTAGRYLLANGRGACFRSPEPLSTKEYIVAANLDGGDAESTIYLAAPIKEAVLEERFADDIIETERVYWDQAENGVLARRRRSLWNLVLSDTRLNNPDKEKTLEAFIYGIRQNGLGVLPWDNASENLRARITLLNRMSKDTGASFPDLSDERLLSEMEWLTPWIEGMTRLEHLKRLDMKAVMLGMLTWEEKEALERLAPAHITVPSGSRIHIDYKGERPVLAVRLQEVFGLDRTPAIAGGRVRLLIHLLSPAGRPVQVTEDLAGFWERGYESVKKELKGRYPKHNWPDDPMMAEASRGVKPRERKKQ